ncbi:MAG: cysteine--1-D-myo-inosityl 2-amino-2-deoxy-alpha-D-glucopyranoside ligase [Propionibacteriaceae bacterium]|jgi:L-cysteine:1D-myo-inositol 2-amino-2-deoxy-alpha-D-glucopyranoside ligase|nr:cysteine--1-D-myo-inosityl 2-amino-2-deoxy-alpha-D-glucopyranoside ligase [Propionibacteriaceae bacterium]
MRSWPAPIIPRLPSDEGRLWLKNTATGRQEATGPTAGQARMYVCGITPYDATHLGHAFTYLTFDLVNRVWRDLGLTVSYTENVTDVDDPLLERATATGADWTALATDQIDLFRTDMTALRIIPPDHYLGVVESIDQVSRLIDRLRAAGVVYQVADPDYPDWYCTNSAPTFGSLSGLEPAAMEQLFAERGGDPDRPGKRHRLDALVWRLARPGEPSWESPWGRGRPGWHVECVALALDTLGPAFDLQGGGEDLIFPHHEMCAAQAFSATGQPLAEVYAHVGLVGLDGEKMSKSRGNLVFVSQLRRQGANPMAIRLALLAHHYRQPWSWTPSDLSDAEARLERWRTAANEGASQSSVATPAAATVAAMRAAVRDDLHADRALALVDAWAAEPGADRAEVVAAIDALLGVAL